ncbi:hypothetical protein D043_4902B, partial [Vibrio parahaemolyticus EKP-021]
AMARTIALVRVRFFRLR